MQFSKDVLPSKSLGPISLNLEVRKEPELLLHYPIPANLRGINPRNILGQEWWDEARTEAYRSNNGYCLACGQESDKPLEAHETYEYDFEKCVMTFVRAVPLCSMCHLSIHFEGRNGRAKKKNAVERAWGILRDAGLEMPPYKLWYMGLIEEKPDDTRFEHLHTKFWYFSLGPLADLFEGGKYERSLYT